MKIMVCLKQVPHQDARLDAAGKDAGGAVGPSRDHGARWMRAVAAPSRGPKGRVRTSLPLSGRHKRSPHEAGVELASPA